MNSVQYIDKLFEDAGWSDGRIFDVQGALPLNAAHRNALKILSKYGNLNVGEVGAGREQSTSDISFRSEAFDFTQEFHNYWGCLDVSLYAFASAHHDHMLLLVDDFNKCYVFTDPDEQLYCIGSFEELIGKVLLGVAYGEALDKA